MLRNLFSKALIPYTLSVMALLGLAVMGGLLWFEIQERFPNIASGDYIGEMHSMDPIRPGEVHYFYLRKEPGQDQVLAVILEEGCAPQAFKTVSASEDPTNSKWLLPLMLSSARGRYRLTGDFISAGIYQGKVTEATSGRIGSWVLRQQAPSLREVAPMDQERKLWLALEAELVQAEMDIRTASQLAPAQKVELDKLTEFVTEGVVLKKRADQKLTIFKNQLTEMGAKLKARYQEAKGLESKIELSQRVTGMGKLVSLARDTLEREARWSDSVLNKGGADFGMDDDLEREFERGQKILELKRAIALEELRAAGESAELGSDSVDASGRGLGVR